MAGFSKAQGITDEPSFAWWVPYIIQKRGVILSVLKSCIHKTTHKYRIEIPTSIEHGHRLEKENGNNFYRDANATKMQKSVVAFEVLPEGKNLPVRWSKFTGNLIWDVNMEFTCKEIWVLDGHKPPDPIGSTYAGFVSRDSARISFTYAALNGI